MSLQAVPSGIEPGKVRSYLERLPGVAEVHDLHIWPMSTTETALTCHLIMPAGHPSGDFFNGVGRPAVRAAMHLDELGTVREATSEV
jgi:cobalt-zinc-cadmium efflux system protein